MDIPTVDILKWIGIVLAAGFVGYFGRYLAMMIIAKMRKNEPGTVTAPEDKAAARPDEALLKLEKKKAKQEVKRAKKAGNK
jgi:hypothetical protein